MPGPAVDLWLPPGVFARPAVLPSFASPLPALEEKVLLGVTGNARPDLIGWLFVAGSAAVLVGVAGWLVSLLTGGIE